MQFSLYMNLFEEGGLFFLQNLLKRISFNRVYTYDTISEFTFKPCYTTRMIHIFKLIQPDFRQVNFFNFFLYVINLGVSLQSQNKGSLAQLVQSTCLTSRGSLVRIQ